MDGAQRFAGRRIALLGSADLGPLAPTLRERGAFVRHHECVPSGRALPSEGWLTSLLDGDVDDVLLTTAQGVRLLVELARQAGRGEQVLRALARVRKIAAGPAPTAALAELGLSPDLSTGEGGPEALSALLGVLSFDGRVVGVASSAVSPDVHAKITSRGGVIRLLASADDTQSRALQILDALTADGVEDIVLGSAGDLKALVDAAAADGRADELLSIFRSRSVLAVGERTARALEEQGITARGVVERSLLARLGLAELAQLFGERTAGPRPAVAVAATMAKSTLVLVGNGMVSHRLCEILTEHDVEKRYQLVVFCEEPRPAYDRVRLTSYLAKSSADELVLAPGDWYKERGIRLLLGERALKIDRARRAVLSSSGEWIRYDAAVLATGAASFIPPLPGVGLRGVFLYRTIEDLDGIRAYARRGRRAVVLGGGLLGLEAAKAVHDLGLETHVVELSPHLMPRQLDHAGARLLLGSVQALGVRVHLGKKAREVLGKTEVAGLAFQDGEVLDADMLILSVGIRPRDELARDAGLFIGDRGGIVVDDGLRTSDPSIYAIGDCALHRGKLYGLVAPGYQMAEACARNLLGQGGRFEGTDQSAKLKLLGVDVASLGDPTVEKGARTIVYEDLVKRVYKKLVLSEDCSRLLGAVLVGDASDYGALLPMVRGAAPVPTEPEELLFGPRAGAKQALSDNAQVCSCNNVTKQQICGAVRAGCGTVAELKSKTRAGTGCGGCVPLVTDILNAELRASGKSVREHLCEHFSYTRQDLYQIVKIKRLRTFEELIATHGRGAGCEICKPTVASILASVHNEMILTHDTLQDSNDRFLANIQRGGLYSVVPRIPGGEITPAKLIRLGQIAEKYGLYTKITGGQRIDLLGARVEQLPDIWEELVEAGFESGHAYGKAMRTVKSCVGSAWCRYGVQDAVGFAIRVENRYKGIRSPHKMKAAVSGCIRECAEAQSKDFGLIATERGWNLYVCGNGGAKPRHADLLAADLDEETALRYIDRFIMFYIQTADRLTRTSVWLEKLEGGIEHLRDVILHDRLGICSSLDRDMQFLVDTYRCEWAEVVKDPEKRAKFRHFVSGLDPDHTIEFVEERGQLRPKDWTHAPAPPVRDRRSLPLIQTSWVRVARVSDVPENGGVAVKYGDAQLAVFHLAARGEWYACQNMCPHKQDMVLARGLVGDQQGIPKVACPQHKKTFSLKSGECLSGDPMKVRTFPVKVQDGWVYLDLPREKEIGGLVAIKPSCGGGGGGAGVEPLAALDAE